MLGVLFGRRQKRGGPPPAQRFAPVSSPNQPQLHRIDYEMMVKGSVCQRRSGVVRQYGVTVNGATRLVTSGDVVDGETYNALLAAGAIRPAPARTDGEAPQTPEPAGPGSPRRSEE